MVKLRFDLVKNLGIRAKLIIAFLGLSTLIAISGASGLFFVHRIGAGVSAFADGNSPMLGGTLQLVENAQRMRAAFLGALNGRDAGRPSHAFRLKFTMNISSCG